jgi:hypothetical protein
MLHMLAYALRAGVAAMPSIYCHALGYGVLGICCLGGADAPAHHPLFDCCKALIIAGFVCLLIGILVGCALYAA